MGAEPHKVATIAELESALKDAKSAAGPVVIVIDTDPYPSTEAGGHWWDVAVPETSDRKQVREARQAYEANRRAQRIN
jgi:3D-(3,5/4)-trihydroxycyclohexane-1,2-dione acylhydrolase (decyclizing)